MSARFEISKNDEGRWYWRLVGHDNRVMAVSADTFEIGYQATQAAFAAKIAATNADRIEDRTADPSTRWRTIAPDGVIGEPSTDPPDDEPDEGETGPDEVDLSKGAGDA